MVENDPQMVLTGKVRLSYANLFQARKDSKNPEKDAKYSCLLLIPKSDTATIQALKKAQRAAAIDAGGKVPAGKALPPGWKNTLRDGDEERDTEEKPEYLEHMFVNASSKRRPGVVDQKRVPITEEDGEFGIKSGDFVRASIRAFAYDATDQGGGKGVTFALEHIQKWSTGEALGGVASKAEDVFDDLEMEDEELDGGDTGSLL